jgi:hypothetical protein
MDVFGSQEDRQKKLLEYQAEDHLFSEIRNSTSCVDGNLDGVEFHEEDMTQLLDPNLAIHGCERVVVVDSNYGKYVRDGYAGVGIKKIKSNRGRKPKQKEKTGRKVQGNGSKFNSCIQFTILGTVPGEEQRQKEYKIKVFRNGKFQIPGVLTEDMSDADQPLKDLVNYLGAYFLDDVSLVRIAPVMRNYKFNLLDGKVDLRKLFSYLLHNHTTLQNISMTDVKNFLLHPIFAVGDYHPRDECTWSDVIDIRSSTTSSGEEKEEDKEKERENDLDIDEFKHELLWSKTVVKDVFVNLDKFKTMIQELSPKLRIVYSEFLTYMKSLVSGYIRLSDRAIVKILELMMRPHIDYLEKSLTKDPDNALAGLRFNPEKYPGLLIYVKTPIPNNTAKRTTVKIFPSGKINIDGANNIAEATHIYWWLNHILLAHPEFRYEKDFVHNETDDEFSESDEDI